MITGKGKVIGHLGYPTGSFKAPMIYNPWFEANGVDAVVVPLGVRPEDFVAMFRGLFRITTLPRRADHHAAQGGSGRGWWTS